MRPVAPLIPAPTGVMIIVRRVRAGNVRVALPPRDPELVENLRLASADEFFRIGASDVTIRFARHATGAALQPFSILDCRTLTAG